MGFITVKNHHSRDFVPTTLSKSKKNIEPICFLSDVAHLGELFVVVSFLDHQLDLVIMNCLHINMYQSMFLCFARFAKIQCVSSFSLSTSTERTNADKTKEIGA